jgi:hypothetical protein
MTLVPLRPGSVRSARTEFGESGRSLSDTASLSRPKRRFGTTGSFSTTHAGAMVIYIVVLFLTYSSI